jgi:hypothetical protein
MNKITTIEWFDDDTVDTLELAAQAYGITVNCTEATDDPNTICASVSGPEASIDGFLEDLESGDVKPMCSKIELSENEYQFWLRDELSKLNIKYDPVFEDDLDDPEII